MQGFKPSNNNGLDVYSSDVSHYFYDMKIASIRKRHAVVLMTVLLVSVGVSTSAIVSIQDARTNVYSKYITNP